jgi:hypothetical protein
MRGKKLLFTIVVSVLPVIVGLITVFSVVGIAAQPQPTKVVTTTYSYDEEQERWVKSVLEQELAANPDGSYPKGSNTLIIRIDENDPVKKIVIAEALIIRGNEPLLEIAGHDTTGTTGKLNIGTLTIKKVDAEELDIDADVVRTSIANVAAEDNELDLDLEVVNVVRTGRGGPSSLYIGINPGDDLPDLTDDPRVSFSTRDKKGLRVDRIRILGPDTGTGFIETLTVRDSSVFGRIEIKNVEVQELVLQDIFLDDTLTP